MSNRFFIPFKPGLVLVSGLIVGFLAITQSCSNSTPTVVSAPAQDTSVYSPPDTSTIPHSPFGDLVRYGRELILHTPKYVGPEGTVGHYLGNKMACTNCHADAGTRAFGFNFFSAHARYPQYRGRENEVIDMEGRINNCVERPGNGLPLPLGSKEVVAMCCYIQWLGTGTPTTAVGKRVRGDENLEIENFPDRPADPAKGQLIFAKECVTCHGGSGEGKLTIDSSEFLYPPLWGPNSFQNGSSPSRVVKMAEFIKGNMPDKKATWRKPYLTDEECLDVAAFINDGQINSRPQKRNKAIPDYPNPKAKPIDYEFGPYVDSFSEAQHKYGPFKPIIAYKKAHNMPIVW